MSNSERSFPTMETDEDEFIILNARGNAQGFASPLIFPTLKLEEPLEDETTDDSSVEELNVKKVTILPKSALDSDTAVIREKEEGKDEYVYCGFGKKIMLASAAILALLALLINGYLLSRPMIRDIPINERPLISGVAISALNGYFPLTVRKVSLMAKIIGLPALLSHGCLNRKLISVQDKSGLLPLEGNTFPHYNETKGNVADASLKSSLIKRSLIFSYRKGIHHHQSREINQVNKTKLNHARKLENTCQDQDFLAKPFQYNSTFGKKLYRKIMDWKTQRRATRPRTIL